MKDSEREIICSAAKQMAEAMTDEQRALVVAKLEGVVAALEVVERLQKLEQQRISVRRRNASMVRDAKTRYDWTDWICGAPLFDKMMGINK